MHRIKIATHLQVSEIPAQRYSPVIAAAAQFVRDTVLCTNTSFPITKGSGVEVIFFFISVEQLWESLSVSAF